MIHVRCPKCGDRVPAGIGHRCPGRRNSAPSAPPEPVSDPQGQGVARVVVEVPDEVKASPAPVKKPRKKRKKSVGRPAKHPEAPTSTYRYRDPEKHREYQRKLMRARRAAGKA